MHDQLRRRTGSARWYGIDLEACRWNDTIRTKDRHRVEAGRADQLGLIPAIEWQAREFQTKTGIQCTLNIYLRTVALPLDRSTGVFRIFQEILTNVTRHAQASGVNITVQEHAGHLLLQVSDNGRGITDAEVSGSRSLGLLGMRERSLLLGGETRIERNPVKGTMVTVRIPIDPQPE